MKRLAVFFILVFSAIASAQPATTQTSAPPEKDMRVFLLIGQSNMVGKGTIEAQDRVRHPRVWMLTSDDQWKPASDPLHGGRRTNGVGLGLTFGKTIADAWPEAQIALVPCAVGGTSIDKWKKGEKLYDNAVRRARLAMERGTVAGILWHQGEADSKPEKKPQNHEEKLAQLIADLRADLNCPDAPFILGQLGRFRDAVSTENAAMNELLMKFPETHPNTACVSSEGLTSKGDNVHFDAASLREFGKRYAMEFLRLADQPLRK